MKGILKELTAKLYSFFTLCSGAFILALAISFTKIYVLPFWWGLILVILSISKFYKNDYFIYLYKI